MVRPELVGLPDSGEESGSWKEQGSDSMGILSIGWIFKLLLFVVVLVVVLLMHGRS